MIAIVNVGPVGKADAEGPHRYEVRINSRVITTFKHTRRDGLAWCLREASDAVARKDRENLESIYQSLSSHEPKPKTD